MIDSSRRVTAVKSLHLADKLMRFLGGINGAALSIAHQDSNWYVVKADGGISEDTIGHIRELARAYQKGWGDCMRKGIDDEDRIEQFGNEG